MFYTKENQTDNTSLKNKKSEAINDSDNQAVNGSPSDKKNTGMTNVVVIILSVIFAGMSALMLFVEGVMIQYLCYALCAIAVIVGIYLIVRYFMTDAYKNVNAYGFSGGTLLVILGICGIVRAQQMAQAFLVIIGIALLLSGIIVLQHSLDLRRMNDVIWIGAIVIAILILLCGIMVTIQPMKEKIPYETVVWWMLLIASSLGFLINIYTIIRVSLFKKKERKIAQESNKKDAPKVEENEKLNESDNSSSSDDASNSGTEATLSEGTESEAEEIRAEESKTDIDTDKEAAGDGEV